MILGIVGAEQAKYAAVGERATRTYIRALIQARGVHHLVSGPLISSQPYSVCSGKCHLGGVDIFAVEEAAVLGIPYTEYPPKEHNWEKGYRPRNVQISQASTEVYSFTVRAYPEGYSNTRFEDCYHCNMKTHMKSGGCWTMVHARTRGKKTACLCVDNVTGEMRIESCHPELKQILLELGATCVW